MSKNENYKVYKHTTPEGKIYIGITGKSTVEQRWDNGGGYRGQYFYEAIEQFGWENIKHKTFIHGLTKEQADRWEIKLIAHFKSNDERYGYNKTKGGDSICLVCGDTQTYYNPYTDEEKRIKNGDIIPDGFIHGRRPFSEETIKKISKNTSGENNPMYGTHRFGELNPFYGKNHTEETKEILRSRRKVINIETGEEKIIATINGIPDGFIIKNEYVKQEKAKQAQKRQEILEQYKKEKYETKIKKQQEREWKQQERYKKQQEKIERKLKIEEEKNLKKQILAENKKNNKKVLKMDNPENFKELIELWSQQRKDFWKDRKYETCPYCGKQGRGAGFYKWHMNNCIFHPTLGEENKIKHLEFKEKLKENKRNTGTTTNKICITDGKINKFIFEEDLDKYPLFKKGMTKNKQ